jgi:hypothetical protein
MSSGNHDPFRLGFLTAVEDAERGMVGGLLVTNHFGRPLEFQCTTPLQPNRTQRILYGPTLRPYVLVEVIGRTLVEKVGVKPHLVLIEASELLELRQFVAVPVASLSIPGESTPPSPEGLPVGKQWLRFHPNFAEDVALIRPRLAQVPDSADLLEPFDRIREALTETLKMPTARSA